MPWYVCPLCVGITAFIDIHSNAHRNAGETPPADDEYLVYDPDNYPPAELNPEPEPVDPEEPTDADS